MNTPSLEQLQRWMKSHIQPGATPEKGLGLLLNPQGEETGEARLSVYAEGYLVRMRESLAEVYEAIHHVLGEELFRKLATAYAEQVVSSDYNLSFAGRSLPDFLKTYGLSLELPFLPDLARLEWSVCQAFHASEEPALDARTVASFSLEDWNRAQFFFQPSVGLIRSSWPIADIWEARQKPRDSIDIDVTGRPQQILIYRRDVQVRCELIEERHFALLEGLLTGCSLAEAVGRISVADDATLPIAQWFSHWVRNDLLCRVLLGAG